MLIELRSLKKSFGGLVAVRDVSFGVERGEIRGLIGPNGAGKTTIFNLISGFYQPDGGEIMFDGQDIAGLKIDDIARLGVIRTFQATTVFQDFSVLENVIAGRHLHTHYNVMTALTGSARDSEWENERRALEILEFIGLDERQDEPAANLSHGHQKALGLAIALSADPRLLMLDEPFAGMNSEETKNMIHLVQAVRDQGITLILVEHDMHAVMTLCDKITVLNFGELLTEGLPDEVSKNEDVIEAYLGGT